MNWKEEYQKFKERMRNRHTDRTLEEIEEYAAESAKEYEVEMLLFLEKLLKHSQQQLLESLEKEVENRKEGEPVRQQWRQQEDTLNEVLALIQSKSELSRVILYTKDSPVYRISFIPQIDGGMTCVIDGDVEEDTFRGENDSEALGLMLEYLILNGLIKL